MRNPDKTPVPVISIFGPTAVGKTALISRFNPENFEIINVDSMQVYRHMDIGTAKPDKRLQKTIPHHLIDILDPSEQFNAGRFVSEADAVIPRIIGRGRIPVLAGGTAFYFENFMYGLPNTPQADQGIREQVGEELRQKGVEALYRELQKVDPKSAVRLSLNDRYRITRALEIYRQTGLPLSAFRKEQKSRDEYLFLTIGLERSREELYLRINERVAGMFAQGLPGEIAGLIEMGYGQNDPGMQAIGYREFFTMRINGCITLPDTMARIAQASRNYAKRQITFFKKLPDIHWRHPGDMGEIEQLLHMWLERKGFDISRILV